MMTRKNSWFILVFSLSMLGLTQTGLTVESKGAGPMEKIKKAESDWKKQLTPEQYRILREKGTEPAFTGEHWDNHRKGTYRCAACDMEIFSSENKFDSGTGWPSFFCPIQKDRVETKGDASHGMNRTEVICPRCGSHLGHVFDDGPPPTHQRYCMNSTALKFVADEKKIADSQ